MDGKALENEYNIVSKSTTYSIYKANGGFFGKAKYSELKKELGLNRAYGKNNYRKRKIAINKEFNSKGNRDGIKASYDGFEYSNWKVLSLKKYQVVEYLSGRIRRELETVYLMPFKSCKNVHKFETNDAILTLLEASGMDSTIPITFDGVGCTKAISEGYNIRVVNNSTDSEKLEQVHDNIRLEIPMDTFDSLTDIRDYVKSNSYLNNKYVI